jgi:hypothetical protein
VADRARSTPADELEARIARKREILNEKITQGVSIAAKG